MQYFFIKTWFAVSVAAILTCVPNDGLFASSSDTHHAARQKINISGRQRMLSQRLAAATCLVMSEIDVEHRHEVAIQAWGDFDKALKGLAQGDASLGLPRETHADILESLDVVSEIWRFIGPSMLQVMAGDLQSVPVNAVLTKNVPLLKTSNAAVSLFVKRYSDGVIDPATATTINIAGRQRMLSQKMMKEACFVVANLKAATMQKDLVATMALFESSLAQLRNGDADTGIIAPPTAALAKQLDAVAALWREYKVGLKKVADGQGGRSDLQDLASQSDRLLKTMHQAVLMYVD